MKKIIVALTLAGLVSGGSAFALTNMANTYYMPIEFGMYHPDTTRNLSNAAIGSIGLGYNLNQYVAVQANVAGAQSSGNQTAGSADQNLGLYDVEAKFSLPTQNNVAPFALVGAGIMKMVSTNPMNDVGVGLSYVLGSNLNATATYRAAYQYGQDKLDSIATLGLSYNFGKANTLSQSSVVQGS